MSLVVSVYLFTCLSHVFGAESINWGNRFKKVTFKSLNIEMCNTFVLSVKLWERVKWYKLLKKICPVRSVVRKEKNKLHENKKILEKSRWCFWTDFLERIKATKRITKPLKSASVNKSFINAVWGDSACKVTTRSLSRRVSPHYSARTLSCGSSQKDLVLKAASVKINYVVTVEWCLLINKGFDFITRSL